MLKRRNFLRSLFGTAAALLAPKVPLPTDPVAGFKRTTEFMPGIVYCPYMPILKLHHVSEACLPSSLKDAVTAKNSLWLGVKTSRTTPPLVPIGGILSTKA